MSAFSEVPCCPAVEITSSSGDGPKTPAQHASTRERAQAEDDAMTPVPSLHSHTSQGDVCSVCLSPFCAPCDNNDNGSKFSLFSSSGRGLTFGLSQEDEDEVDETRAAGDNDVGSDENHSGGSTMTVTTSCQHKFHAKCLEAVKSRKPECPNCRAKLTPLARVIAPTDALTSPQELRDTIRSNANRVRGAMERARLQRMGATNVHAPQE